MQAKSSLTDKTVNAYNRLFNNKPQRMNYWLKLGYEYICTKNASANQILSVDNFQKGTERQSQQETVM